MKDPNKRIHELNKIKTEAYETILKADVELNEILLELARER